MKCFIDALTRPTGTLSRLTPGEGRALPSPAVTWEKVAGGRMRASIVLVVLVSIVQQAETCPFCSDSVTTAMAKGFYWSILFMLAVPFLVVGTIAGVLWRAGRKKAGFPNVPRG